MCGGHKEICKVMAGSKGHKKRPGTSIMIARNRKEQGPRQVCQGNCHNNFHCDLCV